MNHRLTCHHSDKSDPIGRSNCPVPIPDFKFPTTNGPVPNNTRIQVNLPGGFINWYGVYFDPMTRYRLTEQETLDLVRAHTSKPTTLWIEFTRDLNKPASYFFNARSCWWETFGPGNWASSRCSLKNWGGFGIRSFASKKDVKSTGRAWVFPINNLGRPTHDVMRAHAFVVLNGYGDLGTLEAATIVSDLTGMSHKWVTTPQDKECLEVDENGGYLIATPEVMDGVTKVRFAYDNHDQHDAAKIRKAA